MQDSDIDVSLRKLAERSECNDRKEAERASLTPHRKLYGYIRLLQAMPRNVIAFTEAQVSYVMLGKELKVPKHNFIMFTM